MPNQELVGYIKNSLEQGVGKDEIRKTLAQVGWQMGEIDAALGMFQENQVKKYNYKLILGCGLLVLILAGGGFYWWWNGTKKSTPYSIKNSISNSPAVNTQSGQITLEEYVAANVQKYKLTKPDATETELADFAAKMREETTLEVQNLIATCSGLPTLVNSSQLNSAQLPANFQLGPVLAVDKAQTEMYAQTGFGDGCLYRTTDSGATWKSISSQEDVLVYLDQLEKVASDIATCSDIPESVSMTTVAFEGESAQSVFTTRVKPALMYAGIREGHCLYKSTDSGANWKRVNVNNVPVNLSFDNLVIDPDNSDHLYAVGGMFTPPKDSGEWDINTIIESVDGGVNWQPVIIDGLQTTNLSLGSTGKVAYATTKFETWKKSGSGYDGVKTDYYLYQSQDGGKNWNKVYESLGAANNKANQCSYSNIVVDQKNPDIVYAVCNNLNKSLDGGKTWDVILQGDDSKKQYVPTDLIVTNGLLYGVNPASGIDRFFRSADMGKTWVIKNTGFHVYQITASRSNESMIFATDFDNNVYVSKNSSDSWNKINLPVKLGSNDVISGISFHDASQTLFIGTNKGLYSIAIQ